MYSYESLHHIIHCARKQQNLDQTLVARTIGVSQSTYSRIEKGSQALSVYQWSRLARTLQLPLEAVNFSYMDRQTETEIRSDERENGFLLPSPYVKRRCLKIRFLLPLLYYLKEVKDLKLDPVLRSLGMNPSFFYNLDNQVNLKFIDDFLSEIKVDHNREGVIQGIGKQAGHAKCHGQLSSKLERADSPLRLLELATTHSRFYQKLYSVELKRNKLEPNSLHVRRNVFLKKSLEACDEKTIVFLQAYSIATLTNLTHLIGEPALPLTLSDANGPMAQRAGRVFLVS